MTNLSPGAEALLEANADQAVRQVVSVVRLPVRADGMAAAMAAIRENLDASHREAGVLKLALHRERADPNVLWLVEVFADEAARTSHMAEPHVSKALSLLPDLIAGDVASIQAVPVVFSASWKGRLWAAEAASAADAPPYVVIAIFSVAESAVDEALRMLREDALPTYEEPGVLRFAVHRNAHRPNQLVVVEGYRDRAAFDFHHQTPHLAKIAAELPPLLVGDMRVIHVEPLEAGDPRKGLL